MAFSSQHLSAVTSCFQALCLGVPCSLEPLTSVRSPRQCIEVGCGAAPVEQEIFGGIGEPRHTDSGFTIHNAAFMTIERYDRFPFRS